MKWKLNLTNQMHNSTARYNRPLLITSHLIYVHKRSNIVSEDDKVELGKFIAGMANSTSRNGLTICSNGTSKADLIGTDPLFSRPSGRPAGSRKFLTGKMVRTAVKVNIASASLPPIFFSNHSLRKEMYTHMSGRMFH